MKKKVPKKSQVEVRGIESFVRRSTVLVRLLALATDLPLHLLGPFLGIFYFGQPPLPGVPGLLPWLAWSALVHFGSRGVFGRTLGEWAWGLQKFRGEGTLAQSRRGGFRLSAMLALAMALVVSLLEVRAVLLFHPMLLRATLVKLSPFEPRGEEAAHWTELPFYLAQGLLPRQVAGEPAWYFLPYGKGPPERYPPRIVIHLPDREARIFLDAPRTPPALLGRRAFVRECLTSEDAGRRFSSDCLLVRSRLLRSQTTEMRPGGRVATGWTMSWFEVARPPAPPPGPGQTPEEAPMGVYLSARRGSELLHRYVLITRSGQVQALSIEARATPELPNGDATPLEQVVRSLVIHPDLALSREFIDQRIEATNFAAIRGGGRLEKLGQAAMLLASKASVSPADPSTYFEFGGLAMVMLRRSAQSLDSETVAAVSRPQAIAARKFMQDVAAGDPRNAQLEQMLQELRKF